MKNPHTVLYWKYCTIFMFSDMDLLIYFFDPIINHKRPRVNPDIKYELVCAYQSMHYRVLRKYVSKNLFGCQESKINQKQSNQHGEPRCKSKDPPNLREEYSSCCATRIYLYLSRQDIGTSIIANTGVTGVFSIDPFVQINTTMAIQKKASVSEQYCKKLLEKDADIPDSCKRFASIKAQLDAKKEENPFAGMGGDGRTQARNATLIRRMSTRHSQKKDGKKDTWL